MPSIDGGSQTSREYAPHMYLGDHFIHNSETIVQVGDWCYRGGRLGDETIVAERYKEEGWTRTDHEMVSADEIPQELLTAMESVTRAGQYALQRRAERLLNGLPEE